MTVCVETDVLVLGCGIAGGTAALILAEAGLSVVVVTRASDPEESNTHYAQGGIVYRGEGDSPERLQEDVFHAGAGHCYPPSVRILAEEGPGLVEKILLDKLKVAFDRTSDGTLSLAREGSHSLPRILHAADTTGKAIEEELVKALREQPNVTLLTRHTAVDLLTPSHHSLSRLAVYEPNSCVGAYLLDQEKGLIFRCVAKKTILATGGLGQIFLRTSNPKGARGDGLAMANRAGARIINAEFVQFHPTTFHAPPAPNFLISEAVRGEGARLVHADGKPFMEQYDPQWRDLAPRDIVARAIHREMLSQGAPHVYLDLCSYIPESKIRTHFPNIYSTCLAYGVDATREPVPVVPAAHYFCGGVWVDGWGRSTVENLYAVGEVACTGVHGANRLASTSLLEGLVWGERSARDILETIGECRRCPGADIPPWQYKGTFTPDPALISQDMSSVRHIMWNYVGLVRTTHRLKRAQSELRHLEVEIEDFYRVSEPTDSLLGLRNAVRVAIIVTKAAWWNKGSVGCHYRE